MRLFILFIQPSGQRLSDKKSLLSAKRANSIAAGKTVSVQHPNLPEGDAVDDRNATLSESEGLPVHTVGFHPTLLNSSAPQIKRQTASTLTTSH
jgi:hypothetical protein